MRVMIVNVHFAPESFGGATIVAEHTATRLADLGHEVLVFTGTNVRSVPLGHMRRYTAKGLPVIAIKHGADTSVWGQYYSQFVADRFAEVLAATKPDVVHFHAVQFLGVGTVEVAQQLGIPTVVTLHDAWWLCERQFMVRPNGQFCGQVAIDPDVCATCVPRPAFHVERQQRSLEILGNCDRVLVPSQYWRTVMTASGVPEEKVHVNANGVVRPAPGWQRPGRSGPVRFGFVGGRGPIKGHRQLVKALNSLPRDDYVLKVVDAELKLGHRGIDPVDWQVPGQLEVVPGYDQHTMDDFFGSIDVLLFPSQWKESYGLTVREAVLRGVWPIVTDGGGTVENLTDGVNGTVIPLDGGHEALARAVADVLAAPERFTPELGSDEAGIVTLDGQAQDLQRHLNEVLAAR